MFATLHTTSGDIRIELFPNHAPKTVENFTGLAQGTKTWTDPRTGAERNDPLYDGVIFHRVIKGFMIQGGGYTGPNFAEKDTRESIANESKNGLSNLRGTIAMARTSAPHSASAQFFINHGDNDFLNAGARGEWGYAVFGKVVNGMDVVDKIANIPTGRTPPFGQDVPTTTVTIEKASVVD